MDREKIRPLYSELIGYLSQAPQADRADDVTNNSDLWELYNNSLNLLNDVTGEDFDRFLITPEAESDFLGEYVQISTYRQKLSGLISHLHAKYFSTEPAPFSGSPSTVVSQNVQQIQSTQVQILLDIQSKIDEKINDYSDGSKEKSFLQKLKGNLSSITNITQLISKLFNIAKEFGLNTDDLASIFG